MVKKFLLVLVLALAFWPKPALARIIYLTPTPTPTPVINYSNFHPVILIHGLGGKPEDWHMADQNYLRLLSNQGYPGNYIKEYVYADADGNPETYDYQGDIVKISANMKEDVEELSEESLQNGGDGLVDLVGYSLGGLVAREYLHQNPVNHHIRKLITVGTPHQGVWILDIEKKPEILPGVGGFARRQMNNFLNGIIFLVRKDQPLNLNSEAVQQVRPDSPYLAELNNLTSIVFHPKYYTLYGNIDASIDYRIFVYKIVFKVSLGDFFILPNSAVGIPYSPTNRYGFSDAAAFSLNVKGNLFDGFDSSIDLLNADELRFDHTHLLKQVEIQSTIVNVLSS